MDKKMVILIVVVMLLLFACFACGVGLGVHNDSGDDKVNLDDFQNTDWRKSLDNALTRNLNTGDLKLTDGNCVLQDKEIAFVTEGACKISIGDTAIPTNRRLTLLLKRGKTVSFQLTQPEMPKITPKLNKAKVAIDIVKAGGEIEMNCEAAPKPDKTDTPVPTNVPSPTPTPPPFACELTIQ